MWAAVFSFLLGVLGWIVSRLFFEPIKEILDLRRETQEALIAHGDLQPDAPGEARRAAAATFRRIGTGLVSRYIAAYPWVNWLCRKCPSLDIHSAGELLIGLANSTEFGGYSRVRVSPTTPLIRTCLKLKTPPTPPTIQAMMDNMSRPAPPDGHQF